MNNFRICDIPSNNLFKPCFKKFISLCCPHSNFGSVVLNEVSPCNHELSVMIIIVVIIVIIVISVSTLSVLCSEYSLRDGDFKFCRYLWSFSLLGSSLSSSLEIILFTELLLQECGFDHMFSLLKRCKYSLYSDTMLNYWSTNHC